MCACVVVWTDRARAALPRQEDSLTVFPKMIDFVQRAESGGPVAEQLPVRHHQPLVPFLRVLDELRILVRFYLVATHLVNLPASSCSRRVGSAAAYLPEPRENAASKTA